MELHPLSACCLIAGSYTFTSPKFENSFSQLSRHEFLADL